MKTLERQDLKLDKPSSVYLVKNGEELLIGDGLEPTDKDAVINLIRLNIPKYFAPTEETDLNYYLDHERELYYVLLFDGQIVGCGGINFEDNKTTGKISWDILHPQYQGKSLN